MYHIYRLWENKKDKKKINWTYVQLFIQEKIKVMSYSESEDYLFIEQLKEAWLFN